MSELLDELRDELGDQFSAGQTLWLIEELWDDENIEQVSDAGLVEFAWNETGRQERYEKADEPSSPMHF